LTNEKESSRHTVINWRVVRTLALRDLTIVGRSKAMLLPMIVVPLIFVVAIPLGIGLFAPQMAAAGESGDLGRFLEMMPAPMREAFSGYTEAQVIVVAITEHIFAPMFLIIPLMVASTIAAGSFVGEKERGTLEALLHTPTTDMELFIGKLLSAWIPACIVGLGAFLIYTVVANVGAWHVMRRAYVPTATWIVLVIWVMPAAAGLGLGMIVLISSRVSTFQEAYQIGGVVVVPVLLLVFGQLAGVLYLNVVAVLALGAILWAVNAGIMWFGARTFRRDEIIAQL